MADFQQDVINFESKSDLESWDFFELSNRLDEIDASEAEPTYREIVEVQAIRHEIFRRSL